MTNNKLASLLLPNIQYKLHYLLSSRRGDLGSIDEKELKKIQIDIRRNIPPHKVGQCFLPFSLWKVFERTVESMVFFG